MKNPELEKVMDEWCSVISNDVAERRFYDKDEVAAYAKVKLITAIQECLELQNDELELQRLVLVREYSKAKTTAKKWALGREVAAVNTLIKQRNQILNDTGTKAIDKSKEVKYELTNGGVWIKGRLKEIKPAEGYHRNFIISVGYNKNLINCNESNYLQFVLKKDKCSLIDQFKVNDVIVVRYTLAGTQFQNHKGTVYVHNLICNDIQPE